MVLCGVRAMDPPLSAGAAFPSPNAQAQTDAHAPFGKNEEVKARSTRSVRPKIHNVVRSGGGEAQTIEKI